MRWKKWKKYHGQKKKHGGTSTILNSVGFTASQYHNFSLQSLAMHTTITNCYDDFPPKSNEKSFLNKIVNEAGLPKEVGRRHKLAEQQDLVLVCYGAVQHLDNRMSCFVLHNDASSSIWPVWSKNFNNSTLCETLLSREMGQFYYVISQLCSLMQKCVNISVHVECLPALLCLAPVHLSVPLLVPWNQHQLTSAIQTERGKENKRKRRKERRR